MEQGNEGDEIIMFSCRQIGCEIPNEIQRVNQLTAESLIHIIAKCLELISNGEIKVPTALPPNIASRHRICTDISLKIKDLGFLGECGYNQLLYPVEHQTRDLLKWIIDKVPRSSSDGVEELVTANAIFDRNVSKALSAWQNKLWKLPACSTGKPLTNIHKRISFYSTGVNGNLAAALIAKNSLDKAHDTFATEKLNRNFNQNNKKSDASEASNVSLDHSFIQSKIKAAIKETSLSNNKGNKDKSNVSTKENSAENNEEDTSSSALLGDSFQTLISTIVNNQNNEPNDDNANIPPLETRFAHATIFAQESSSNTTLLGLSSFVDNTNNNSSDSLTNSSQTTTNNNNSNNLVDKKAQFEREEQKRQEEIQSLRSELQSLSLSLESQQSMEEKLVQSLQDYDQQLIDLQKQTEELENDCVIRKKALEMIPSAAENIAKLQMICEKNKEKLGALEEEWKQVREPFETQIQSKEKQKQLRIQHIADMIEEIKQYKELMGPMLHDLKEKQDRAVLLEQEKAKLPKNLNRSLYTHRILDITASIAKQNKEITKITNDIRDVQKTINLHNNALTRSDAITEELIYKAAIEKNDSVMIDTYRRLKNLRNAFNELIQSIQTIGNLQNSSRELETKIDKEKARIASYNYDRIFADLASVNQENEQLMQQIKTMVGK